MNFLMHGKFIIMYHVIHACWFTSNNSASKKPNIQKTAHLDPTDSSGRKRIRDSKDDNDSNSDDEDSTTSHKSNQKKNKKHARTAKVEDEKVSNEKFMNRQHTSAE
jgi:hypothetical protein